MADQERPFPPGAYPVIVIGSGPGGLQVAYELAREGIGHVQLVLDPITVASIEEAVTRGFRRAFAFCALLAALALVPVLAFRRRLVV